MCTQPFVSTGEERDIDFVGVSHTAMKKSTSAAPSVFMIFANARGTSLSFVHTTKGRWADGCIETRRGKFEHEHGVGKLGNDSPFLS